MNFNVCKLSNYQHVVKGQLDGGSTITITTTPHTFPITSSSQVLRIWSPDTNAPLKFTFKNWQPTTPPSITVTIGED